MLAIVRSCDDIAADLMTAGDHTNPRIDGGSTPLSPSDLVVVVGAFTLDDIVLPDGTTHMATLGGNCIHAATAVLVAGASAAIVARRGEDFPATALMALAHAGVDLSSVTNASALTIRNWVVYEWDGRRTWINRTSADRHDELTPHPTDLDTSLLGRARVIHIAALPLHISEALIAHISKIAPRALVTLDTHEDWLANVRDTVLRLARDVDVFAPSLEELLQLTDARGPVEALFELLAVGCRRVVLKAGGSGAYVLDEGQILHVPALESSAVDTTGAGDAFCGGLAAGLARRLTLVDSVCLGAAVAGTAISAVGSLRLLDVGQDRDRIHAAGRDLARRVRPVSEPGR
jgi:sugar/nucleoside kinase (ribokinase family)